MLTWLAAPGRALLLSKGPRPRAENLCDACRGCVGSKWSCAASRLFVESVLARVFLPLPLPLHRSPTNVRKRRRSALLASAWTTCEGFIMDLRSWIPMECLSLLIAVALLVLSVPNVLGDCQF